MNWLARVCLQFFVLFCVFCLLVCICMDYVQLGRLQRWLVCYLWKTGVKWVRRRLCSQYAAGWPRLLTIQHLHIVQFTHNKTQDTTKHNTQHDKNTMPKVQREVSMPLDGHTFFLYNQLQNHVQKQKHNVYTHTTQQKTSNTTNLEMYSTLQHRDTMCIQYAGWPPLTPLLSPVCATVQWPPRPFLPSWTVGWEWPGWKWKWI